VLAAGLVDEVRMDVVPVVFGSGKRYFGSVHAQHLLEDPDVAGDTRLGCGGSAGPARTVGFSRGPLSGQTSRNHPAEPCGGGRLRASENRGGRD